MIICFMFEETFDLESLASIRPHFIRMKNLWIYSLIILYIAYKMVT